MLYNKPKVPHEGSYMRKISLFLAVIMILCSSAVFAEIELYGNALFTWNILNGAEEGYVNPLTGKMPNTHYGSRPDENGNWVLPGTWIGTWANANTEDGANMPYARFTVGVRTQTEDGKFGGFTAINSWREHNYNMTFPSLWWQPSPKFKMHMGNMVGMGYIPGISSKELNSDILPLGGSSGDGIVRKYGASYDWVKNRMLKGYGAEIDYGIGFQLWPIDDLNVVVGLNFNEMFNQRPERTVDALSVYSKTSVHVNYKLNGFGDFRLAYDGGTMKATPYSKSKPYSLIIDDKGETTYLNPISPGGAPVGEDGHYWGNLEYDPAYFNIMVSMNDFIPDVCIGIAFDFPLPVSKARGGYYNVDDGFKNKLFISGNDKAFFPNGLKYQEEYKVDLKYQVSNIADIFEVRGAFVYTFGGYTTLTDDPVEQTVLHAPQFGMRVNPFVSLGALNAGLVLEMNTTFEQKGVSNTSESGIVFETNSYYNFLPYIKYGIAGGVELTAGFQVAIVPVRWAYDYKELDWPSTYEYKVRWSIPLAFSYSF